LIGRAGRQVNLNLGFHLGFHLDDAGGDLDQPQPGVSNCATCQDERGGISVRRLHNSK
jgi:hypothetical protein